MDDGDLLTVREVAARLRLSPATVRRIIRIGQLEAYRVGNGRGRIRVRVRDLRDYVLLRRNLG